mgnify:CR=1 FL=1
MIRHTLFLLLLLFIACRLQAGSPNEDTIAQTLESIRNGKTLTHEMRLECQEEYSAYYKTLFEKSETDINKRPVAEGTDFFINAMKMSIIHPEKHAGWPTRWTFPQGMLEEFDSRMEEDSDPMLRFCAIYAALREKEKKYAVFLYEELKRTDPFLAREILIFAVRRYDKLRGRNWIASYYQSAGNEAKVKEVSKDVMIAAFPKGLRKAAIDDFEGEPKSGIIFKRGSDRMKEHDLKAGDIIVSIDGYRCCNSLQYEAIRNLKTGDLTFIVWDGNKYREITASLPNRLWGAIMASYPHAYRRIEAP